MCSATKFWNSRTISGESFPRIALINLPTSFLVRICYYTLILSIVMLNSFSNILLMNRKNTKSWYSYSSVRKRWNIVKEQLGPFGLEVP